MWFLATYEFLCWISIGGLAHIVILVKYSFRGNVWQGLPTSFLIFMKVYISFDWCHSSNTLWTDTPHIMTLNLFCSVFFWTRSSLHPSFLFLQIWTLKISSWPIIILDSSEKSHASSVYSPNSLVPTPSKSFLMIYIFNNKFLFNNTPSVIIFLWIILNGSYTHWIGSPLIKFGSNIGQQTSTIGSLFLRFFPTADSLGTWFS